VLFVFNFIIKGLENYFRDLIRLSNVLLHISVGR
jgi:hypothetical protein